jgi:hypothetical protein
VDFWWINLGAKSKISDELLMNIFYSILTITFGVGLVYLSLEISKEFVVSTKVLSMSKTFNLSMIEFVWTIV